MGKKKKLKRRSAPAFAALTRSGSGKHGDKRYKRNKKRRKYDVTDGWGVLRNAPSAFKG